MLLGRIAHKLYDVGEDYVPNREIPGSGLRLDAVNWLNRIVRELKPFTKRAMRRGSAQLNKYLNYLNENFGSGWQGVLDPLLSPC